MRDAFQDFSSALLVPSWKHRKVCVVSRLFYFLVHQTCEDELGIGHLESGMMLSQDLKMNISLHNPDRALFSCLRVACSVDCLWSVSGCCLCHFMLSVGQLTAAVFVRRI